MTMSIYLAPWENDPIGLPLFRTDKDGEVTVEEGEGVEQEEADLLVELATDVDADANSTASISSARARM